MSVIRVSIDCFVYFFHTVLCISDHVAKEKGKRKKKNKEDAKLEAVVKVSWLPYGYRLLFHWEESYTRTGVPCLCMAVINGKLWVTTGNFASLRH